MSGKLKPSEFKCAQCKGVFTKGWTDEEARAELEKKFPGIEPEECDSLCDECYEIVTKFIFGVKGG